LRVCTSESLRFAIYDPKTTIDRGQNAMKKGSIRRNKTSSLRSGFARRRRPPQADRNFENLKVEFDVLSGTCGMIELCAEEKKIFERILNLIGKAVECSQASLFILDRKTNRMQEVASVGKRVDLIDFVRFDKGSGFSAWVAKEKRPILLSNLHRKRSGGATKSFLAVPLILNGEVFGVMNFSHIRSHAFEPTDVEFLTLISVPVALGLERAFYHSELERLEEELRQERGQAIQLQDRIKRMESLMPTPQLLEGLSQKIKTPLSSIAENAQFLLNSFSARQKDKSRRSGSGLHPEFKRGLKEIKNEVAQIARVTEKTLRRRTAW
jgi:transcriptional regulator with GAF, ATPase, and Fis domain